MPYGWKILCFKVLCVYEIIGLLHERVSGNRAAGVDETIFGSGEENSNTVQFNCTSDGVTGPEFKCLSGLCIRWNHVCDFKEDCEDGGDEEGLPCQVFRNRCDFEDGLCQGWHFESSTYPESRQDFFITSGMDYNESLLPSVDHTKESTGKGRFVSLLQRNDADNERQYFGSPKEALMVSDIVSGVVGPTCILRFWYFILGDWSHRLHVIRRITSSGKSERLAIYVMMKYFGVKSWTRAEIVLGKSDGQDFQVIFKGVLGNSSGSVSIDDVSFSHTCIFKKDLPSNENNSTSCKKGQFLCSNQRCIQESGVCNMKDDCADGSDEQYCGTSCGFEEGMCSWWITPGLSAQWVITPASRGVRYRGPQIDQTEGDSGSYLYPLWNRESLASRVVYASINSPKLTSLSYRCRFTFWYYFNNTKGTLTLRIVDALNPDMFAIPVWTALDTTTMGVWKKVTLEIGRRENFRLTFQAGFPREEYSQMALDSINFQECQPTSLDSIECGTQQWKCSDESQCIDIWMRCDGTADCIDSSDEIQCDKRQRPGDCDFHTKDIFKECQWSNMSNGKLEWIVRSSTNRTTSENSRSFDSHLAVFSERNLSSSTGSATITTPWLEATNISKCILRFWYNMQGDPLNTELTVYFQDASRSTYALWYMKGDVQGTWRHVSVPMNRYKSPQPFRIIFKSVLRNSGLTNISKVSIDAVHFAQECGLKVSVTAYCARTEFACGDPDYLCIPGIYVCDGLSDCPNGEDERHCLGESTICEAGFFHCKMKDSLIACVPKIALCDREEDCEDGTDESICGVCYDNYCKHNGTCVVEEHSFPTCNCTKNFMGNRCSSSTSPLQIHSKDPQKGSGLCVASLDILTAAIMATCFITAVTMYCFFELRKNKEQNVAIS